MWRCDLRRIVRSIAIVIVLATPVAGETASPAAAAGGGGEARASASEVDPHAGFDRASESGTATDGLWQRTAALISSGLGLPVVATVVLLLALGLFVRDALRARASLGVKIVIGTGMCGEFRLRLARQPLAPFLHRDLDPRSTERGRLGGRIYRIAASSPVSLGNLRPGPWYVAVAGYIARPVENKVVGEFREERCVRLAPGEVRQVRFDFGPRFGHVRLRATRNGVALEGALVVQPGSGDPLRSTGIDGTVGLEVPFGPVELLVGHGDRVASRRFHVTPAGPEVVEADLGEEADLRIDGCPEAVEPFLRGDLPGAARALEAGGLRQAAHRAWGVHYAARAYTTRAIEEFVRAGELLRAAELLESLDRSEEAAEAYLQGGHHLRAAALFRRAGSWERAGEGFERGYLYEEAADCYERAGLLERALPLFERAGLLLRAGEIACLLGDHAHAAETFERIPKDNPDHAAARRRLEELNASPEPPLESGSADPDPHPARPPILALPEPSPRPRSKKTAAPREQSKGRVEDPSVPSGAARRYEILEEIGRGTMGIVFKAYDRALRRTVALKRLPRWMADSPRAVGLFLDEARAAARLSHPHIVIVHDVVREGATYFVTMEYLDGSTLRTVLQQRGAFRVEEVVRVARQMLSALGYAHAQGVVHRDVKPQNLILTAQGAVKLTDFGLARVAAEVCRRGELDRGGTPDYMAPEQSEGRSDARSDLYAVGVCLFEFSTGRSFSRDRVARAVIGEPPPLTGFPSGFPPLLVDVIRRLLAPDPAARFQSAEEVLGVLEWLEQ